MTSFNSNFSPSSSSNSDERRSSRAIIDQEINDFLTNIVQPLAPTIISNVTPTPRNKRTKVTNDNEDHQRPNRGREEGHRRLFNDYFTDQPVYLARLFRRRFRMQRHVFLWIMESIVASDVWFTQKRDCTGQLGLLLIQKCTSAIRMLAYEVAADSLDEYVRISQKFTTGVIKNLGAEYLRWPTPDD
ncbi:uncharacterized protein LOC125496636 [Beta vulgaris subsp. vulgaris]|uniref:uncharacterized protein LOC125496636 n=1 Tax=Beta vulgaris subsp. vulgaris TaxID=3555 RepID=UPI00203706E7|nr:uncharacterized protein LOC125496636 [Beta vulgaris subsp. vulgaris]